MRVNGQTMRSIWSEAPGEVRFIDQRFLPHHLEIVTTWNALDIATAIRSMQVRGAPLIGVSAAWGMALGARRILKESSNQWESRFAELGALLESTRPTAVNLSWAVQRMQTCFKQVQCLGADANHICDLLDQEAKGIAEEDVACCKKIGEYGLELLRQIHAQSGKPVRILTHCNAGWLACVDYGTATAPMYMAYDAGIPLQVWVDETRPRNQGAKLTAWELGQHGVPHALIPDNAGGHLMQHGLVDLVITGADRVTCCGDVANKIGTYLKALAAHDNGIPFYVALPSSTIDWALRNGVNEIPIETRGEEEVRQMDGLTQNGSLATIRICPESTPAVNYGFDVTPARLVTGLITERGCSPATEEGLLSLYPERRHVH
ncbi:MAG TPA: S-methyl-5-thioribose-1-phosphate isomerase [Fibrobacteraceae bacterium]|nr:S-methyl-5-thioribose-1-phosphate isomerase [Fibrobacteraceae bacterium]